MIECTQLMWTIDESNQALETIYWHTRNSLTGFK